MSHPDAPALTSEQERMERWYRSNLPAGTTLGFGRNKHGEYHAEFARLAWKAWQAAQHA